MTEVEGSDETFYPLDGRIAAYAGCAHSSCRVAVRKRFTLKGKVVFLEKVQNRLYCTLHDGSGLVAAEMENMLMNIEIRQGQILCLIAKLKSSPDGSIFCEARGITLLKEDDPKLKKLADLPEGYPPAKQGRRSCRNHWEGAVPVAWARLQMVYKLILLIPAFYLIVEPHLFQRLILGSMGTTLGMLLLILFFSTGRQVIKKYGQVIRKPADLYSFPEPGVPID